MNKSSLLHVRVSGVSALRDVIGKETLVVLQGNSTLGDLLIKLEEEFGSAYMQKVGEKLEGSLRRRYYVLYNGQVMPPEKNLDKTLSDNDELLFFQWTGA